MVAIREVDSRPATCDLRLEPCHPKRTLRLCGSALNKPVVAKYLSRPLVVFETSVTAPHDIVALNTCPSVVFWKVKVIVSKHAVYYNEKHL